MKRICLYGDFIEWRILLHKYFHFGLNSTALKVYVHKLTEYVQQDGLYKVMKEAGLFDLKGNQDIVCEKSNGPNIKDDNQEEWSEEIKEVWPYYIHGVSRAGLKMIDVFVEKGGKTTPRNNLKDKLNFYVGINNSIREQWFEFGDHSMLHHLNALFGYNLTNVRIGNRFGKGYIRSLATYFDPMPTNLGDLPILQGLEGAISL